jgi:GMP synthase-like glutamine amidotransferase
VLVIEHEADSGAAMLGERFQAHGFELDVRVPVKRNLPKSTEGYAAVLSLGASPSVNDTDAAWWLEPHLALLRDADQRGVPVLGVCFGAQALAVALGGTVTRASQPEVGWYSVDSAAPDLIESGPWLQWHVDAVTPPPGATVLATSAVCVQAYAVGRHLAVQFHPEVTSAEVASWVVGDVARFETELPAARERVDRLVDRFLERAGLPVC